jgi:hypothetical protein
MLSGVVVAVAALAVLVLAAPPGPSSVVAIGEPSTYTGPPPTSSGNGGQPEFPGCPFPVDVRTATVNSSAAKTAALFAHAWTSGDAKALIHLSDQTFAERAANLQLGSGLGRDPRIAVAGIRHSALAKTIAGRCGPDALKAVRIATVRARTPGAAPVHLYIVWRGGPSRVWAVR